MRRRYLSIFALLVLAVLFVRAGAVVIPTLTGFVRDGNGAAVVAGDLDFFDSTTGVKLITHGDNTDALGFYSVSVLQGVYDVTFAPPPGTRLMGRRFDRLDMTNNIGIELNVVLNTGLILSGVVTQQSNGLPAVGVDIDVDRVGGARVFTPNDKTGLAGAYAVVVPSGFYRVRFDPPPGGRLRGVQIDSLAINADAVLDAMLPSGLLLSGRVSSVPGPPLVDIEVDLRDFATGEKVFVSNNTTDIGGDYSVAVPSGVFQVRFVPPLDAPYIAVAIDSLAIDADLRRDQVLQTGHRVRVVITDTTGVPLVGADVDAKNALTQQKLFTPHDKTDASGKTTIVLATDNYDLQFDPPIGTTLDRVTLRDVRVSSDTTITVALKEVPRVRATGRVVDELGAGIPGVEVGARVAGGGTSIFIASPLTDATGAFDVAIPIGDLDITFTPQPEQRFVGRRVHAVVVVTDSAWTDVVLPSGLFLRVRVEDEDGSPVARADLDIIDESTSLQQFVPRDETNALGSAVVVLEGGTYTVVASPPPGSKLGTVTVAGVEVTADTTLTITLSGSLGTDVPELALGAGYPNPFSSNVTVPFEIKQPSSVVIRVYNVAGQLVKTLVNDSRGADTYQISWDGTNNGGIRVSGGIYFIDMQTAFGRQARKVVLIR